MNTEASIYFSIKHHGAQDGDSETEKLRTAERLGFQWKIYLRSGVGEQTCASRLFFDASGRVTPTMEEAQIEMEECFVAVLDKLFAKTGVVAAEIDILIVNVSTFSPAPSLAAWIVNRYKMKESVKSFNLAGMGCSASVIAVDMAYWLLNSAANPDAYALLVGTENITLNGSYTGSDKSMMLTNCLFRVGGNAVLLSNKPAEAKRAKMRLLHTVRTNLAARQEAYDCIMVKEDDEGRYGISLLHSIISTAGDALRTNLGTLGPRVLPLREQLLYAYTTLAIKFFKVDWKPYIPNFRTAFQHFCIHPGGRSVITGIGKSLKLTDYDLEPSRMSLFRFGNTSTSGVWYEVAYLEAKRRLKVGDRLVQIALGSGFKCNTAVWEVLRETHCSESTVWDDCIHRYPCNTRKNLGDDHCNKWLFPSTASTQI
ncbi:3-ketoacyl-CoA synthase 1 [Cryptomeria japonica]|uniref:3-ketoacyl-CoA synthase 1 n=1 Tax=Cryptomeria japonica TaxID=3369 RepID=UPI0027DA8164|nr:3-ketoacyl-CoA synthase 1 [Cryptomeria japonica]